MSLDVRAGEIVGLAGLVGSGRSELAQVLFGITPAERGDIRLDGEGGAGSIRPRSRAPAGIAYVPEDRGAQGLVRPMSVLHNFSLAALGALSRLGFIDRAAERRMAEAGVQRFSVKTSSVDEIAGRLSGGNQQKIVLGKWLANNPKLLILDEPTRGIDVGAKAEIHRLMCELAGEGVAILMISSELPEVLGMSDRVLVMREGRLVAEFDRAHATSEAVGAAMMGSGRGDGARGVSAIPVASAAAPRAGLLRRFASQEALLAVAVIGLAIAVGFDNPRFLAYRNLADILLGNAYIAIAAIGMSMVIISGNIDISVGALIGVLATLSGSLAVAGAPTLVAWLVPVVLGVLVMAAQGAVVAYLRIPAIVVTLGMMSILKGGLISVTGGNGSPTCRRTSISPTSTCSASRCRSSSWSSRPRSRRSGCATRRAAGRSTPPAATPRRRGCAASIRSAPSSWCSRCTASSPASPRSSMRPSFASSSRPPRRGSNSPSSPPPSSAASAFSAASARSSARRSPPSSSPRSPARSSSSTSRPTGPTPCAAD